jgi:hypothetical protein
MNTPPSLATPSTAHGPDHARSNQEGEWNLAQVAASNARSVSKPAHENQYNEDDQDDADDANAAMTEAVAIATEPAAESTKQEDDEDDDEYKPDGHDLTRFPALADDPTSF